LLLCDFEDDMEIGLREGPRGVKDGGTNPIF